MAFQNCTIGKNLAHSAVIEEGWATNRSTFSFYKDMLFDLQRGRQTVKIYWTRHKGTMKGLKQKRLERERLCWPKRLSYCYPWLTWVTYLTHPPFFGVVSFSLCCLSLSLCRLFFRILFTDKRNLSSWVLSNTIRLRKGLDTQVFF